MKMLFNLKTFMNALLIFTLIPMSAMAGKEKKAKATRKPASTIYVIDGLIDRNRLTEEQQIFYSNLNIFCMTIPELRTQKDFNKLMNKMTAATPDGNIVPFWTEFGCEPRYIAKTEAPLITLISENSTDRMKFLEMLKVYLESKGDTESFKKIINAKYSRGHTPLDYIQYVYENKRFHVAEEPGLNLYIKFLCDNGAEFSLYKDKSCPMPYLKLMK
jgi:hypothetical protein